ncbi:uncharacterized protein LOC103505215 [Diaphorina citri]|uniref:Uncharacterized protein LOC103505215 n=1 Tax=Diaphorina citri TaxID=121845 RepID=A0A1S3CVC1_DIACI|nr:uncharacterized protein LOC103505215 [Diaphorina citri]
MNAPVILFAFLLSSTYCLTLPSIKHYLLTHKDPADLVALEYASKNITDEPVIEINEPDETPDTQTSDEVPNLKQITLESSEVVDANESELDRNVSEDRNGTDSDKLADPELRIKVPVMSYDETPKLPQLSFTVGTMISNQPIHYDKHSLQKTLDRASSDSPYTTSPTKAPLISNQISFKELKQTYNEFQNRVREGKKIDEWDEFVNQAQFRVRPDPQQERIDYVPPNFKDYRITCPKGIFYQNDNADKMSIRDNENLHAVLNVAEKIKRKKTLGLKSIDETQLKFYLYDGNMKDNLPDGIGMGYFQDDIYYYGKWKGGKFNGKGVLMSLNEYSYEGISRFGHTS